MNPPHGIAEIRRVYGDIRVEGDQVVAPPHWESSNMIKIAGLPGLPKALYCHRLIVEPLRVALTSAAAACPDYKIRTIGCFAPRAKRVNGDLSTHSWGIAVDINADTNPLAPSGGVLVTDMPPDFVASFEGAGFTWGGRWTRPDAMHLQFASGY